MKISAPHSRNFSSEGTSEISQLRSGWSLAQRFFLVPQGRRTFSTVLSGRDFLRTVFQPLRSWLISGGRSATQFAVAALILFFAVGARAETTNALSDAEIQGQQLAKQIANSIPENNLFNTNGILIQNGILKIKDNKGVSSTIIFLHKISITPTNWYDFYVTKSANPKIGDTNQYLAIQHTQNSSNYYEFDSDVSVSLFHSKSLTPNKDILAPFANSDFWLCDLGLEFFHWSQQMILKKEMKRSRGCSVLESTNPNPSTNGYSRVVSWVDNDGGGIVQAFAYDAQGKKLKEFYPNSLEKVNGQYQVKEMDMNNVQTGSRTRLTFDLKK